MKAITLQAAGGPAVVVDRPMPSLRPGYMLVKTVAVALNPADIFCLEMGPGPGPLLGCDYSGRVVAVGEGVERRFAVGDRVCGCTRPADPHQHENGTFAEHVVVKADVQLHIPDEMSFEEAASLGVTTLTTGRYFFDKFGVEYPKLSEQGHTDTAQRPRRQILIYGGSSAMGTMAIQYAKLANFFVLSTAAPHNTALVRSYGADVVVDHYSPTSPAELRAVAAANAPTMGQLLLCLDNISRPHSAEFCAQVLTPDGTLDVAQAKIRYSTILPYTPPLPGIDTVCTLGYSFLGEPWEQFGQINPASREDFEAARRFAAVAETLLARGLVKPHPVEVHEGGLDAVAREGLAKMKAGVSGKKLVYQL